jgi:hypothetical protein
MKLKIPKGYRVGIVTLGKGMYISYDYRIFHNGNMIQSHSGTSFNYKEDARNHGIETAMIYAGTMPDRMDFKKRKEMGII